MIEKIGLVSFYNDTNGHYWTVKTNWPFNDNCCIWFGVTCNAEGRIVALELPNNNLRNHREIFKTYYLPLLKKLDLSRNHLRGNIENFLPDLCWNLEELYLQNNQFSGLIFRNYGYYYKLQIVDLSHNRIERVAYLTENFLYYLKELRLNHNQMRVPFSPFIAKYKNLEILLMNNNFMTGPVPKLIGVLPKLREVDLTSNRFTLSAEPSLTERALARVKIYGNPITSVIPDSFRENPRNLFSSDKNFASQLTAPHSRVTGASFSTSTVS